MGVWGPALYSGDFAMDLRATIGAIARLPFDADQLVDILCEAEPAAANNPADEEHTTFWLILADQFAKRSIVSDRTRKKATIETSITRNLLTKPLQENGVAEDGN